MACILQPELLTGLVLFAKTPITSSVSFLSVKSPIPSLHLHQNHNLTTMCRHNFHHHTAYEHNTKVYENPFIMCGADPGSMYRLPCQNPANVVSVFSGYCRYCTSALEKKLEDLKICQEAGLCGSRRRRSEQGHKCRFRDRVKGFGRYVGTEAPSHKMRSHSVNGVIIFLIVRISGRVMQLHDYQFFL